MALVKRHSVGTLAAALALGGGMRSHRRDFMMYEKADNRAVTALFRAFGGAGKPCLAEASQRTARRAMHVGELRALALWIPLTVFVAVGDWLCARLGMAAGLAATLPAGFAVLSLLPFALGGKNDGAQWRRWLGVCTVWAGFHREAGGIAGVFAWGWIAIFALNAAAFLCLSCGGPLRWGGRKGVAARAVLLVAPHAMAIAAGWWWGWWWALAGGALIAAAYCWCVLRPGCQWLGPVICRTGGKNILITIDDGPDPRDTPVLLDLLDRYQTKAVFFMIGEIVAAHPELAREVVRRGHEIGNHTMTHPQRSFWRAGPRRTRREISECQRVIEEVTGVQPHWFRAPVGHRNWFTHPIAAELDLKVMAWNRRGYDAVEPNAERVLARILPRLGPGDIVLVHEATPIAAEVLEGVLKR